MHLALNFQRVDPARGGAETYVADLCRHLVGAGHRVDLYAESWADGCLPAQVNVVPVAAPGRTRIERISNFAKNSEEALRQASHDCSVGFINTYAHDVIIPQGGVQLGSLTANARRFSLAIGAADFTCSPRPPIPSTGCTARSRTGNTTRLVIRGSSRSATWSSGISNSSITCRASRSTWSPTRSIPSGSRCRSRVRSAVHSATDSDWSPATWSVCLSATTSRSRGSSRCSRPWAPARAGIGAAGPIHLLVCGSGEPGPFRRLASRLGLNDTVHFLGFYPDVEACYWSSDFFVQPTYYDPCSLVVLEALACGLPVITTAQNGASELLTDGARATS